MSYSILRVASIVSNLWYKTSPLNTAEMYDMSCFLVYTINIYKYVLF